DLQIGQLAKPLAVVREEDVEGVKPLNETLGIVKTIDSDHEIAATQACDKIPYQWRLLITARQSRECPRLDTNRKTADQRLLTIHLQGDVATSRLEHPGFPHLIAFEN